MKNPPDLSTEDLINKANSAIQSGSSDKAREYALAAAQNNPGSEQAWLILASLSDPEQALLYIENALRANPQSRSARKAVRLVYSQMAAKRQLIYKEQTARSLSDTSPIEVPAENLPEPASQPVVSQAESIGILPTVISRKKLLRQSLQKRSASAVQQTSPSRKSPRFIKKAAPEVEEKPTPKKAAALTRKTKSKPGKAGTPPASRKKKAISEGSTAESAVRLSQPIPGVAPAPVPAPPAQQPAAEPLLLKSPLSKEITIHPPEAAPSRSKGGKSRKEPACQSKSGSREAVGISLEAVSKKNNQAPANVDTIELVLVSVAAILLPLLVFLYFYLTR